MITLFGMLTTDDLLTDHKFLNPYNPKSSGGGIFNVPNESLEMHMKPKSTKYPQPLPLDIKKSKAKASKNNVDAVFKDQIKVETISEEDSKSASVKFMITIQDEIELRNLGYSEAQIYQLKPQKAAEIIHAGMKAEDT
jgi:hypothetical protein